MIIDDLELDLEQVDNGVWVHNIPELDDVSFQVRGTDYKPYQKALRQAMIGQSRKQRANSLLDADYLDSLTRSLMAEHLLMGWEGIDDREGQPIAFTRELAKTYMTERRYRPFQAGVMAAINRVDTNTVERKEELAGN